MVANQKSVPGLNRVLSSNFWWLKSENYVKSTEECVNCTKKHILVKKMFTKSLNTGLPWWAWVEKIVSGVETHWLSCKEKVLGTAVGKESHADSCLVYERMHQVGFTRKRCKSKQCFQLQNPLMKFILFIGRILYL